MQERVRESPEAIQRYELLKDILASHLGGKRRNIAAAYGSLSEAAQATNPTVWREYWEHVLLAPALAAALARAAYDQGIPVNPIGTLVLTYLHDVGRMVTNEYLHNDDVTTRALKEAGVTEYELAGLPSTRDLMQHAEDLDLSEAQLRLAEPLNNRQLEMVDGYVSGQSPCQRIINIADNLGKISGGQLFTMELFAEYLKNQETRYSRHSRWGATAWSTITNRRPAGAVLQWYTVAKSLEWLIEAGVRTDSILNSFRHIGPSFTVQGTTKQILESQDLLRSRHFDPSQANRVTTSIEEDFNLPEPTIWVLDQNRVEFTHYQLKPR